MEFLLCVQHCSKYFTCVDPFNHHNPMSYALYFLYVNKETDAWMGKEPCPMPLLVK